MVKFQMMAKLKVFTIVFASLISNWTMGQRYESQPYEVLQNMDEIEIRFYPPAMMAKTKANTGNPFSTLFRYISGANQNNEKIEMTTPGEKPKPDEIKAVIIREFAANSDFGDMPFADLKRLAAIELNVSQKTVERYVKKLIDAKVFKIDGRSIIEGDAYAG